MKKKKIASLLLAASLTITLAACAGTEGSASDDSSEDPIVIGTISPNTGSLAAYGTGVTTGVELAAEEINAAGGILGRQVEIITTDDQGDPTECLNAFNSLVSQGVSLIIGSATSGCTSAITEAANEEEVVLMAPTATADSVTTEDDYIFRVCYADSFQGAIAAAYAKKAGYTNVGVVYCAGDVYSKGLYDSFTARLRGLRRHGFCGGVHSLPGRPGLLQPVRGHGVRRCGAGLRSVLLRCGWPLCDSPGAGCRL